MELPQVRVRVRIRAKVRDMVMIRVWIWVRVRVRVGVRCSSPYATLTEKASAATASEITKKDERV